MGIANVVPGISGGAMLLMLGVYSHFIQAMARFTTLRANLATLVILACVGSGAVLAILLSAGFIKDTILTHRWQTFSVFIGLRLGAIPIVYRLARPTSNVPAPTAHHAKLLVGALAGLAITVGLALMQYTGQAGAEASTPVTRFLAGLVGASATILPGMDGSYFLLLMGEYVPILSAIDDIKDGILNGNWSLAWSGFVTCIPVGIGVALGLGGVSVVLRWLLAKHRSITVGVLLGVLVGAIGGLWPFRKGVPPQPGDIIGGLTITTENAATIEPDKWKMVFFSPAPTQIAASIALIALGTAIAYLFAKLEPKEDPANP